MKRILLIGFSFLAFTFTGCMDFLDINQNPNYPTEMVIDGLLPAALVHSGANLGYELQLVGSFWSQHCTQYTSSNQYNNVMNVNLNYSASWFSAIWVRYYAYAIPSLRSIREKAIEEGDDYLNYKAMSEIMIAFGMHIINSAFDQAPYDEAFQGSANLNPHFHSGEELYVKIMAMLEDVLAYDMSKLENAAALNNPGSRDYVFQGNINAWMKFANTLYLKMLLRDFDANRNIITTVLADASGIGFLDEASGDAKLDIFVDLPDKSNPLYESDRRQLNTSDNMRTCNSIYQILATSGDPRAYNYYQIDEHGNILAVDYGASSSNSTRTQLAATDPVYFTSVAEAYFLKAEAYARLGDAANAKAAYDAGVMAAFARWGHDGTTFVEAGGAYEFPMAGSVDDQFNQIITQKWIAAVRCQAWDSWFDLLRTGYPERGAGKPLNTFTGILNDDTYPARFLFPQISKDYNTNCPEVINIDVKMWWHKQ